MGRKWFWIGVALVGWTWLVWRAAQAKNERRWALDFSRGLQGDKA